MYGKLFASYSSRFQRLLGSTCIHLPLCVTGLHCLFRGHLCRLAPFIASEASLQRSFQIMRLVTTFAARALTVLMLLLSPPPPPYVLLRLYRTRQSTTTKWRSSSSRKFRLRRRATQRFNDFALHENYISKSTTVWRIPQPLSL